MRGKLALLLILILALGFLAARLFPREKAEHYPDFGGGEDEKLLPVDQGKENPDFLRFREELQSAVERKDLEYLKRHLSDKIRYTFGENHSTRGFLRAWKLDEDPSSSEFWRNWMQFYPWEAPSTTKRRLFSQHRTCTPVFRKSSILSSTRQ